VAQGLREIGAGAGPVDILGIACKGNETGSAEDAGRAAAGTLLA
jgi:hypothetical protein